MSSFDEWWEENYMMLSADRTEAEDIYNIGAQSRQAEIDELNKRIDDALSEIYKEKNKAECDGHSKDVSDLIFGFGYHLHKILKGQPK